MQPIAVPSNVTISLQGQDLKVKGPLGELALTYPPEVELTEEDSGFLRVRKTVETRRAKEMHGLFRLQKLLAFFNQKDFNFSADIPFLMLGRLLTTWCGSIKGI